MLSRQQAIDAARGSAAESMRANGKVVPMIIGHAKDRAFVFPLGDWLDTPTSKDLAVLIIGAELRKQRADLYVVITEAWYAPTSLPLAGVPPSQRPDRVEVLLVSASDRDGDTLASYRTVRNARGRSHH